MTRGLRRGLSALLGVAVLALVLVVAFALWPTRTRSIADRALPAAGTAEMARLVEAGRYVATAADCVACHSPAQGAPFTGGLPLASPLGTIYSTNITPDVETGIGRYGLDDFDRVIRHGIAKDGRTLYPAMPYPSYARLSDDDLRALYAYMLHGVAPVRQANRENGIPWPLSMRWPLAAWRKVLGGTLDAPPAYGATDYGGDAAVARGAYLVQAAGHCGACHTARGVAFQEKGLDERSAAYLAGGQVVDGWVAVNLRGDPADGLGRWNGEDIVRTLRGARNRSHAVVGGPMQDVVVHSTQSLSDGDLAAIAAYLKTLPASRTPASTYAPDDATARALESGREDGRGAELYVDNCAACHRTNGLGHADAFPTIAGNPTVLAAEPTSLVRLVLAGSVLPETRAAPSPLGMPAFAWRLSDAEVAALLTFVRQSWGNRAPAVSARQVASVRTELRRAEASVAASAVAPRAAGGTRTPGAPDKR